MPSLRLCASFPLLLRAISSSTNCFFPEPASVDFVLCPRSLVLVNLLSLHSLLLFLLPLPPPLLPWALCGCCYLETGIVAARRP